MKPIISESVYKTLYELIIKQKSPEIRQLGEELSKAEIVKDNNLKMNIVSLNSIVEYIDESLNKTIRVQIVLPAEANLEQRKISILAPVSIALIGFKERDRFSWKMQTGTKYLCIIKVVN